MLSLLGAKGMFWGAIVALCLVAACGVMKHLRYTIHPKERRERRERQPKLYELNVSSVPNGALMMVKSGRHGRKEARLALVGVMAPSEGEPYFDEAREQLRISAGSVVRVEIAYLSQSGLLVNELASDDDWEVENVFVDRHRSLRGIVYGESGVLLNIEMVARGLAECLPGVPPEWMAFQEEAKKRKLGMWSD